MARKFCDLLHCMVDGSRRLMSISVDLRVRTLYSSRMDVPSCRIASSVPSKFHSQLQDTVWGCSAAGGSSGLQVTGGSTARVVVLGRQRELIVDIAVAREEVQPSVLPQRGEVLAGGIPVEEDRATVVEVAPEREQFLLWLCEGSRMHSSEHVSLMLSVALDSHSNW